MDDVVVSIIRDHIELGFKTTNDKLDAMAATLKEHLEKDEAYWRKIDIAEGQIKLIKGVGGSSIVSALGAWLWAKFGIH